MRALIPSAIALTLIVVYNNGFPHVTASPEVRQQWADKEFRGYPIVVNSIKICQPIIERVGSVKFVAPNQGKNYLIYEANSSSNEVELSLDVSGNKGVAFANIQYSRFTHVAEVQLTYQDKTEKLNCRSQK
ncbi:hypothetical protein [Calothrix sp. NIES-2098]|uniref:hypothetical protein n=1 Tax=Calothrix sp. NIES-2098 TaxID=1954171 RepID=UPI0030DBD4C2